MGKIIFYVFILWIFAPSSADAGWLDKIRQIIPTRTADAKLSDLQIGKGLKEALSVGIDKAVVMASQEGGYLNREDIKIKFPEKLSMVEGGLRKIGMGHKIDDFEENVNRVAEKSAPLAKSILMDALFEMSIQDAQNLLNGGETAATDYFKEKTWERLHGSFKPKMSELMNKYQASQAYNQIAGAYEQIPFAKKPDLISADDYATSKALEGLFVLIAEQERKIRTDPAARVTELLKTVFSKS